MWTAEDGRSLSLAAWAHRDLLVDTYRTRLSPIFVPISIDGLPAVQQKSAPDAIACTVTTGVANGQALETTWYSVKEESGAMSDPCKRATAAAEAVVSGLPPLS